MLGYDKGLVYDSGLRYLALTPTKHVREERYLLKVKARHNLLLNLKTYAPKQAYSLRGPGVGSWIRLLV